MYGFQPKSARNKTVPQLADGGSVPFGSRGVAAVRDMIPKMQAMGFQPAQPPAAPTDTSNAARLRAMIPQMEAMGYKQQPQYLADGGMVHSLTGMLGFRPKTREELLAADAKAQARNQEAAARVASRPAPAPAAPAPQAAISDYSGMNAMQRREKEQGLKEGGTVKPFGFKPGGLIRGPGTGTSDSIETEKRPGTFIMPADSTQAIGPEALEELGEPEEMGEEAEGMEGQGGEAGDAVPVRLSNGEFELPPEQVQALGEAVLTVMRDATHKATGGGGKTRTAAGFVPSQSFADGGAVQDEEKKRLANQTAMYVQGAQAQAASRPAAPTAAPTPAPANAAPKTAGFMPSTRAVFNESGKAIGDLASQGRYGAAAGETARAALAYGPAVVDDVVGGAWRAAAPAVADAGKQFLGIGESASATAPPTATQPASSTASTTPATAPAPTQSAASPALPATERSPVGDTVVFANGRSTSNVTRDGNSYAGTNVAGDISINGQEPGGGIVSAPSGVGRVAAGFVPRGSTSAPSTQVAAPTVRNSTNDWAARNNLRNLQVSASSITNTPEWSRGATTNLRGQLVRGQADQDGNVAAYQAALRNDQALQQAQTGVDQAAMRESGANQRAAVQDAGATERAAMQEQGATTREAGRTAVAQGDLALRRTAQGFQTRAAAQQEALRNVLLDPNATPEQRKIAQRSLASLSGKTAADRMQVVNLPDTVTDQGVVAKGGQALIRTLEDGTVEQVPIGGKADQGGTIQPLPKKEQLVKGQVYQTARGQARWDGAMFQPV
ncbi:hypothetical protein DBR23_03660 [Acidovorax sp. HMWF018]|nr:hypothetical protein DBR23_03660 [Acidovorax sp. HMWF018]